MSAFSGMSTTTTTAQLIVQLCAYGQCYELHWQRSRERHLMTCQYNVWITEFSSVMNKKKWSFKSLRVYFIIVPDLSKYSSSLLTSTYLHFLCRLKCSEGTAMLCTARPQHACSHCIRFIRVMCQFFLSSVIVNHCSLASDLSLSLTITFHNSEQSCRWYITMYDTHEHTYTYSMNPSMLHNGMSVA